MEIKVGEYVRTEFGNIGKFYRPASESSDVYYIYINKDGNKISSRYDSIVKHSKNIIDLIECGDYVNGRKVICDTDNADEETCNGVKHKCIYVSISNDDSVTWTIVDTEIYSVLTHEQFSSLEYII